MPADVYDAAGNLHNHPDLGQMTYDAQNRLVEYTASIGGGTTTFVYDGEGRRVQKIAPGGTTTIYVYDGFGQLAAEYGGGSTDAGRTYLTADHLGSTRLVTRADGSVAQRQDYQPFGGTLIARQSEGNRDLVSGYATDTGLTVKFTGKEEMQKRASITSWPDTTPRLKVGLRRRIGRPRHSPFPMPISATRNR